MKTEIRKLFNEARVGERGKKNKTLSENLKGRNVLR